MLATLTRRGLLAAAGFAVALSLTAPFGLAQSALPSLNPSTNLWYDKPAAKWEEALPVGSGRLGAMVFGGVDSERIQFNEDTLWTGKPQDYVRPGAIDGLADVRRLIFEAGKPGIDKKEQERLVNEAADVFRAKMISKPVRQKAYQPFGDLRFTFPGMDNAANYRRNLDLDTAIATTTYTVNGVNYKREVFASYPDNVIVVRITADQPGKVNFSLKVDTPHKNASTKSDGRDLLALRGQVQDIQQNTIIRDGKIARENKPDVPDDQGLKFNSLSQVSTTNGKVSANGDTVTVANADSATVVTVAATNFVNFQDVSGDAGKKAEGYLKAIAGKDYAALLKTHLADYQPLFRRVSIDLGHNARLEVLPTNERQKIANKVANPTGTTKKDVPSPVDLKGGVQDDPSLVALFFQYGRYMLITSSRPGTQAANLQGVWNQEINPPWESKYTTNINFEMNYWPAEVTNLSECHTPFFDMIDDLRISGARTAKEMYGVQQGWVLHHNTDLWRGTAPINNIDGMWTTGGAWLCHHLWEHYLYTGDKEFLAKRAYPAMKEASEFFVGFLVKDPNTGRLVTNPAHSPEQGVLNAGPAMDMQLIRAVFDYTTEASKILGNVDKDFIAKIAETRKQLVPDQIGQHGQLQEWQADIDVPNNNHRHMSPLWGLFPGNQFTPEADQKTYEAAKLLLAWRGDGSTGWSYSWRIPLWARVGNGDMAFRQLALQMGKRLLPNLFDLCGPYQADGNYGSTGGIAEMLLQSHQRVGQGDDQAFVVELLPALPKAWPSGSIKGLKARGGFEVTDLVWQDGRVTDAKIKSLLGNDLVVKYHGKMARIETSPNQIIDVDVKDGHVNLTP
ncbi:MAG: glycoside hydrolase family 95 protein [Tepidisphaeraceae bacterium]